MRPLPFPHKSIEGVKKAKLTGENLYKTLSVEQAVLTFPCGIIKVQAEDYAAIGV